MKHLSRRQLQKKVEAESRAGSKAYGKEVREYEERRQHGIK